MKSHGPEKQCIFAVCLCTISYNHIVFYCSYANNNSQLLGPCSSIQSKVKVAKVRKVPSH